ncbi:alkaline phosphatase synthesis transcriptional regulatory protein PhoP [Sinorhizobium meliloti CCNWSX0020]|uniref:Alkaline phosphatase synthesis transcriptional regulatory protein PhoP n=1 Tax=Sinorhizobium meliloti CCNWSX0020 TaxID=1107881 RepID=H0G2H0_RHIML|nr:response regulator [Sinorhizobium meliloti]EHK76527.1 alkaline phosphatase synthesis transcriptional regulatory protein PhoP [Sinorhizobium meliloti CCNWSX0020]
MTIPGKVYVVDDDVPLVRALVGLLRSAGYEALPFDNPAVFLKEDEPTDGACIILDLHLQETDGLDVQQALLRKGWAIPIIFLTGFGSIPSTVAAMQGGAANFLTKPVEEEALLQAVDVALSADSARLHDRRLLAELRARLQTLTPRELEVLPLAADGKMIKQIAYELGTSEITAKVHKKHVMEKMKARTLADLVRMTDRLSDDIKAAVSQRLEG